MDAAQLSGFLRRRRERVEPADVGLPAGPRRRTPGLRREEVAQLAGMSTDYYTRLEQRRAPQPSEQILTALARALRLTVDERDHLFRLAGHHAPARGAPSDHVGPGMMRILDRLDDTPALVISDLDEPLAQNRLAVALLGDQLRHTGPARSLVWRWFTDPDARQVHPPEDHDHHSAVLVANLRAALVRRGQDVRSRTLVDRLRATSTQFAALWDRHEVAVRRRDTKRIVHPELGLIELHCQTLYADTEAQRLLVFTAEPGSRAADQLRLLSVIGTQRLTGSA
jgi:transcriptional regulator with XRE-family HTH domain